MRAGLGLTTSWGGLATPRRGCCVAGRRPRGARPRVAPLRWDAVARCWLSSFWNCWCCRWKTREGRADESPRRDGSLTGSLNALLVNLTHPCELFLCLSPSIIHCRIFWFLSRSSSCTWASMPRPLSSPLPDISVAFLPPLRASVLPLLLQNRTGDAHTR